VAFLAGAFFAAAFRAAGAEGWSLWAVVGEADFFAAAFLAVELAELADTNYLSLPFRNL
jgi:hypothetical protein